MKRHGPLRIGVVGAGRSRNGLGPFLARACERAGAQVVAVAGRNAERSTANAASLAELLLHPVAVAADAAALCSSGIDVLVVATPQDEHLGALRAAADAGVACLCEKPLVAPSQRAEAAAAIATFARRGHWLGENCQWPFVLPAVTALHGEGAELTTSVAMGMSPMGVGTAAMVRDALPHLLSVVQAAVGPRSEPTLLGAAVDDRGTAALACRVRLDLGVDGRALEAVLELRQCTEQPRPAWLAVDGRRIDRRIGKDYAIAFAAGGRELPVVDPMQQLVDRFLRDVREGDADGARSLARTIDRRLELYCAVLDRLDLDD